LGFVWWMYVYTLAISYCLFSNACKGGGLRPEYCNAEGDRQISSMVPAHRGRLSLSLCCFPSLHTPPRDERLWSVCRQIATCVRHEINKCRLTCCHDHQGEGSIFHTYISSITSFALFLMYACLPVPVRFSSPYKVQSHEPKR